MLQSDTPYIVVPMEVMDKLNHQLFIFRANNGSKIKPRISILIPDNPENCPLYWTET